VSDLGGSPFSSASGPQARHGLEGGLELGHALAQCPGLPQWKHSLGGAIGAKWDGLGMGALYGLGVWRFKAEANS
jgi:hypothetical protein